MQRLSKCYENLTYSKNSLLTSRYIFSLGCNRDSTRAGDSLGVALLMAEPVIALTVRRGGHRHLISTALDHLTGSATRAWTKLSAGNALGKSLVGVFVSFRNGTAMVPGLL
jgi:hypothetical protein